MLITFTPMRCDDRLSLHRVGDVLTVNGEAYDFAPLLEGAVLPRDAVDCSWLASDVRRQDGELQLTLILPHGPDAPEETLFPAPLLLTGDGPVLLPGGAKTADPSHLESDDEQD